jgi:ribosomal protein S27AE
MPYKKMIRLYTALCKAYLEKLTDKQKFQEATDAFSHLREPCPNCGAVGKLTEHGDYDRGLTSYEDGQIIDSTVRPERFFCSSCETSHALLPDIIIPYGRYSILFVLAVLVAYFERAETVAIICEQFGIAVSTIYEWKDHITLHKELMIGALISQKQRNHSYVLGLMGSDDLSDTLYRFFRKYGFSFMQNRSASASRRRPP